MFFKTALPLLVAVGGVHAAHPRERSDHTALRSNLVYRSPSTTVDALALDTHQAYERHDAGEKQKRWENTYAGNLTFDWGVASGDPYDTSVILWTKAQKVDLINGLYGADAYPPICLTWVVSTNETDFSIANAVSTDFVYTTVDVRFTAKVEATGLSPYTQYFYRFESCEGADLGVSPVGKFKTLPSEDQDVDDLRLAVFSCSNLPFGFFNAFGNAANHSDTLDWVQHLGDYYYEYQNGVYGDGTAIGRIPLPLRECSSLEDYRDRFASYRLDPDLQELHRVLAWQLIWDDHEVADNSWAHGSADSNNTIQGQVGDYQFAARKANAVRAYFEWMPIRQVDTDDKLRIWRSFKLGKLGDMIMLDTRQYDRSITDVYYNTDEIAAVSESHDRSMTGSKQQKWLYEQLKESSARGATWPLIMQQVVFSRVNYSTATGGAVNFDFDDWEGYRYEREQILDFISDNQINNTVILSGDSHASWVFDLKRENATDYDKVTGSGALGVEFAGSAVSSPSSYGHGPGFNTTVYNELATALADNSPALQFAEGQLRGYFELTVSKTNVTADYFGFVEQLTRNSNVTHMGSFTTLTGTNKLLRPINGGKNLTYGAYGV